MSWFIYQTDIGTWRWEHVDENAVMLAQSEQSFLTREDCLADARNYGFVGKHAGPKDHGAEPSDHF